MKPYTRKASVLWVGIGERGKGSVSTPSAVLNKAPYGAANNRNRRSTNPPELIAAAQASSFSMTLASELGAAGHRPRQIDTTAMVTMESIAAGWTMTQIYLDVIARVPKVAQCDFLDAALRAKANCPISRSLNANISMRAKLSDGTAAARLHVKGSSGKQGHGILQKNGARRNGAKN